MTKIILSHEDYERVLREGIDLDAYLQGRFDEAASDVKYLNEEVDVTIPINLEGERLGEALAQANTQAEVDAAKSHALHAQMTADRAISQVTELAAKITELEYANRTDSITLPSGKTYTVGDEYKFPQEDDTAVITGVDKDDVDCLPIKVSWKRRGYKDWMSEGELSTAFKIN